MCPSSKEISSILQCLCTKTGTPCSFDLLEATTPQKLLEPAQNDLELKASSPLNLNTKLNQPGCSYRIAKVGKNAVPIWVSNRNHLLLRSKLVPSLIKQTTRHASFSKFRPSTTICMNRLGQPELFTESFWGKRKTREIGLATVKR